MMAGIAVRAGTSLTDRDDSSLPPVGRTARTPRRASPSLLHDSALCTASTTHAKTPIPSSSDQETLNSSPMSTPTGTKLAVTTTYDSPAGGEEDIEEDPLDLESFDGDYSDTDTPQSNSTNKNKTDHLEIEKEIALSQLQELEVAIKVRKVTKVDGRKVRWIEYRARKAEEEKNNNSGKPKRRPRRSKTSENDENALNIYNNNNSEDTDSMKGEVISTPHVLESMKLQFLQGTENIEGPVANGNGDVGLHKSPDAIQKRKSSRTRKSQSTPKENKEIKSSPKSPKSPKSATRGTPKGKSKANSGGGGEVEVEGSEEKSGSNLKKAASKDTALNGSSEILTKIENVATEDIPSSTPTPVTPPCKVGTPASSPIADDMPLSCLRPVFKSVTKGLREVRKTENGTDGEIVKSENGVLSPITAPDGKYEIDIKCMPITPSPPLLLTPSPRAKSADSIAVGKRRSVTPKRTKASLSKSVERVNSKTESITNGHHEIQNGSPIEKGELISQDDSQLNEESSASHDKLTSKEEDKLTSKEEDKLTSKEEGDVKIKRLRGRPSKRKLNLVAAEDRKISPHGKSAKKVETVVADVHNSMNGEPQTVIPLSRPILRGKKPTLAKKSPKGNQKVASSGVDTANVICVKASEKKSTSSVNVGKGKDKSLTRPDAKKKVTVSKKKSSTVLQSENVEISATSSASVNNQTQATPKSKSTKPGKGATTLELLPPVKLAKEDPSTPPKTSLHTDSGIDDSDSEQLKGKNGKAEKSLAGRVIRRGKSPETLQAFRKSPLSKGHLCTKGNLTTKSNPTGKANSGQKASPAQKPSNIEKSLSEKLIPASTNDQESKVQHVKSKATKNSEGSSPRKSSVTLEPGLSLASMGRSNTSPGILVSTVKGRQASKAGEAAKGIKELQAVESQEEELQLSKKTLKGKAKAAKSKEESLTIQKEVAVDQDVSGSKSGVVYGTIKKGQKKGTFMENRVAPKKSLESKSPSVVLSEGSQPAEVMKSLPSDDVSRTSTVSNNAVELYSVKKDQSVKDKYIGTTKQKKMQLNVRTLTTKRVQKDVPVVSDISSAVIDDKETSAVNLIGQQTNVQKLKETDKAKIEENLPKRNRDDVEQPRVDIDEVKVVGNVISDIITKVQSSGTQVDEKCLEAGNSETQVNEDSVKVAGQNDDSVSNNEGGQIADVVQGSGLVREEVMKTQKQQIGEVQKDRGQLSGDLCSGKGTQGLGTKAKGMQMVLDVNKDAVSLEKSSKKQSFVQIQPELLKEVKKTVGEKNVPMAIEPKIQVPSSTEATLTEDVQKQTGRHEEREIRDLEKIDEMEVKEIDMVKSGVLEETVKKQKSSVIERITEIQKVENAAVCVGMTSNLRQDDNGTQSKGSESMDEQASNIHQRTSVNESDVGTEFSGNNVDVEKELESRSNNNEVSDVSQKQISEVSTKVFYAKTKSKKIAIPKDDSQLLSEDTDKDGDIEKTLNKDDIDGNENKESIEDLEGNTELERNRENFIQSEGSMIDAMASSSDVEQPSEMQGPSGGKSKEKVPRILKQLFQDEGVQNMLKSMNDESVTVPEGSPSDTSGVHKLRPKRPTEPMLASSPELDGVVDALFSTTKKRKRWSELDTLYMDEGVLNLLTSIDPHSRRAIQDDAASDISQASSIRSVKTNKSSKSSSVDVTSESRKRKLSGASTVSNTSTKSMQPPDSKKICLEQVSDAQDPYEYNASEEMMPSLVLGEERIGKTPEEVLTPLPKKKGRPALPLSVKQKNKAIRMQLKIQKQKHMKVGSGDSVQPKEDDNMNLAELKEELRKQRVQPDEDEDVNLAELQDVLRKEKIASSSPEKIASSSPEKIASSSPEKITSSSPEKIASSSPEKIASSSPVEEPRPMEEQPSKSIPPLKIKLASDSVTISHIKKPAPKKQSVPVVGLQRLHDHPQLQQQPQAKPQPQPQQRPLASGSGSSSTHLADIGLREPARASTSAPKVYPVPQPRRVDNTITPTSSGFPSLVRTYELGGGQGRGRPRFGERETLRQSQRASVRQSEANHHYRDIALRKFNNFTQIILSPSTTKMKNALNSRVLRELCEALSILKRDETVRMVLLTATGPTFCQGIDLTALQHPNLDTRKKNAENLVRGIKEFLKTLVQFHKPIIAGVNGNAMGLGVTMLPLFDLVIVNDKAEFYLPYAKLGQIPEGGATYTFPNLFGKLKSTQLFLGHKITASMALDMGLASESIWPATYQQELIPKVALLATQSAQSMEATKALMNHHLITKLELSLESECRLLLQHWMSPHFGHLCKRFLDTHHIHLQKPVNLPL